jgi:hypothetical protein
MSKNIKYFFILHIIWSLVFTLNTLPVISEIYNFNFVFVLLSGFFLFKEVFYKKLYRKNHIPIFFKFITGTLIILIFFNLLRDPPGNVKGFIRFLGGRYYVAAWFPILFIYIGSKIQIWSHLWISGFKLIKLFTVFTPLIIFGIVFEIVNWNFIVSLVFILPLFILNWVELSNNKKIYVLLCFIGIFVMALISSSRAETLRLLIYIPFLYLLIITRKRKTINFQGIKILFIMAAILSFSFYIYNGGLKNIGNEKISNNISEFGKERFENTRTKYVYPDFLLDMKDKMLFGNGLNGTTYSYIFESIMENSNESSNSLGVKPGYRREIESGYLQTILKIGSVGLFLKLLLALSAIYLGFFKSNNYFVKGCAFIIVEWLISMYPSSLPEYRFSYILFWLCIGACLSRETRLLKDSTLFIRKPLKKQNILK